MTVQVLIRSSSISSCINEVIVVQEGHFVMATEKTLCEKYLDINSAGNSEDSGFLWKTLETVKNSK